jgi:Zn-dependent protease
MSTFDLYLIMRLDDIKCALAGFGIFGVFISIIAMGVIWGYYYNEKNKGNKISLFFPIIPTVMFFSALFGLVLQIFLPTTKEAAVLYCAPKIVNSEFVQEELPAEAKELYGLAKQYLQGKVKESK